MSFRRPIGAGADLAELEYISALHQSQTSGGVRRRVRDRIRGDRGGGGDNGGAAREDGSVRDQDIRHFIRSRYGVDVSLDDVRGRILPGLTIDAAGPGDGDGAVVDNDGDDEDDEEGEHFLDLAELSSALLTHTMHKAAVLELEVGGGRSGFTSGENDIDENDGDDNFDEHGGGGGESGRGEGRGAGSRGKVASRRHRGWEAAPPPRLLSSVLSMILLDAQASGSGQDQSRGRGSRSRSSRAPRLTTELLGDVLRAYGETDLADDEGLLEEMVAQAANRGRNRRNGAGGGAEAQAQDEEVGGGGDDEELRLDAETFAVCLSADLAPCDLADETRLSTNEWDVLGGGSGDVIVAGGEESSVGDGDGDDAWGEEERAAKSLTLPSSSSASASATSSSSAPTFKRTFLNGTPGLDFHADRYGSKSIATLLWIGFVLTYQAYLSGILRWFTGSGLQCMQAESGSSPTYGCEMVNSIVAWLVTLCALVLWGGCYIGLGSVGNHTDTSPRRRWSILIGMLFVGIYSSAFFVQFFGARYNESVSYTRYLMISAMLAGNFTMLMQVAHLVGGIRRARRLGSPSSSSSSSSPSGGRKKPPCSLSFFSAGAVGGEAGLKRAAARKLDGVARNALDVHAADDGGVLTTTCFGRGLLNFAVASSEGGRNRGGASRSEDAGGFLWVWSRILGGTLLEEEGIWISARVLAGNLGQLFLCVFILMAGGYYTNYVTELWRKGLAENGEYTAALFRLVGVDVDTQGLAEKAAAGFGDVARDFLSLDYYVGGCGGYLSGLQDLYAGERGQQGNSGGESTNTVNVTEVCDLLRFASDRGLNNVGLIVARATEVAAGAIDMAIASTYDDLYPREEYMVFAPMATAVIFAFCFCFALTAVYVPSYVSTALQFRSGGIPLLHDRQNFQEYRTGMQDVTVLLGSMFWGALYSSALLGIIVGIFLFLVLWQVTSPVLIGITAVLIGLGITGIAKLVLSNIGLGSAYAGFYRKKVAMSNFFSMLLECANIAYTVLTALVRAGFLIAISSLYIGRMDTPLLAPGVGIGSLTDKYPSIFRKEILAKEAHRHPYIETLGKMYLMKLRYGQRCCNRAGYCYRLIFTMALMPWLRKYRVMARPHLLGKNLSGDPGLGIEDTFLRQSVIMASMTGSMQVKTSTAGSEPEACHLDKEQLTHFESTDNGVEAVDDVIQSEVSLLRAKLLQKDEKAKLLLQELQTAIAKIDSLETKETRR